MTRSSVTGCNWRRFICVEKYLGVIADSGLWLAGFVSSSASPASLEASAGTGGGLRSCVIQRQLRTLHSNSRGCIEIP